MRHPFFVLAAGVGLCLVPLAKLAAVPVLAAPWSAAPRVDGVWGRGEWRNGASARLAAEACSRRPVVRVIEAEEGLYVGFWMDDTTPIRGGSAEGGSLHKEDVFEIFFAVAGDERRYAELQIARSGAAFYKSYSLRAEPEITGTGRFTESFLGRFLEERVAPVPGGIRWAAGSSPRGWTAEVFLPRRLLGRELRANFAVHDWDRPLGVSSRTARFYYWSSIEPGCPHISPSRFGRVILRS